MGVIEPGIERMRGQVGQIVGGQSLEGLYHRLGVLGQEEGIVIGFPLEPAGESSPEGFGKIKKGAEKGRDEKKTDISDRPGKTKGLINKGNIQDLRDPIKAQQRKSLQNENLFGICRFFQWPASWARTARISSSECEARRVSKRTIRLLFPRPVK